MTIKTLVAVALAISIIIVLFTITKVTTPSRLLARAGTLLSAAALKTIGVLEQALLVTGKLTIRRNDCG